jgi:hypothetical protein
MSIKKLRRRVQGLMKLDYGVLHHRLWNILHAYGASRGRRQVALRWNHFASVEYSSALQQIAKVNEQIRKNTDTVTGAHKNVELHARLSIELKFAEERKLRSYQASLRAQGELRRANEYMYEQSAKMEGYRWTTKVDDFHRVKWEPWHL